MFRIAILSLSLSFFLTACQPEAQQTQQAPSSNQASSTQTQQSPKEQMEKAEELMASMETYVANEDFEGAKVDAEQAVYYLNQAVSIDPNYAAAVAPKLARAYFYNSQFEEAQTWYLQALDADPDNPQLHKMLGLAQFNLGNISDAQNSLAQSIKFDESEENRQEIVNEMMRIGRTSFDFGTAYIEDGYPSKGADYQKYGLAMYRLAFDLEGHEDQTIAKQIVTWATFLEDQEVVDLYQPYLK